MKRSSLLLALLLGACTVGPDYAGPPATAADAVARGRFARAPADTNPAPGLARWWEGLDDAQLTALVDDALRYSPTINQAAARIREAEAQLRQQRRGRLPSVSANATVIDARLPGVGLGQQSAGGQGSGGQGGSTGLDFYNLGLNASWELDLFGGGRRGVEQSRATAAARVADLADAQDRKSVV